MDSRLIIVVFKPRGTANLCGAVSFLQLTKLAGVGTCLYKRLGKVWQCGGGDGHCPSPPPPKKKAGPDNIDVAHLTPQQRKMV